MHHLLRPGHTIDNTGYIVYSIYGHIWLVSGLGLAALWNVASKDSDLFELSLQQSVTQSLETVHVHSV